jgi:DNA-binding transcriptional LysR family regulator
MSVNFREIEIFWAVSKAGSIKGAASLLNISQPAVSMMLKNAEARFGFRLFERTAGKVVPTYEGRTLFQSTSGIFLEIEEFERQLGRVREGRAGVLRIAATPTLDAAFIHGALPGFRLDHPDVRIHLRTIPTHHTVELVASGDVDFGLAYGPAGTEATDSEDLCTAEVGCVVRHDHRLATETLVTPDHLRGESILTYRPDTPLGRAFERALRGMEDRVIVSVQSTAHTAAHLAHRGLGVALIDPFVLESGIFPELVYRPFSPGISARVQLLTPRQEPMSNVGRDFVARIRALVPPRHGF